MRGTLNISSDNPAEAGEDRAREKGDKMGDIPRGPVCVSHLGDDWVDGGTLARWRSSPPGVTGLHCLAEANVPYPAETARAASFLIRQGYIRTLANSLPPGWTAISDRELTKFLASRYREEDLRQMFLMRSDIRVEIKTRFRNASIFAALIIGLIWARENIADGDWDVATAKIGGMGAGSFVANRLLYSRDPVPEAIMTKNPGNFGKWFKGAARSNRFVNSAVEFQMLLLVAEASMSGAGEYPSIPWDIVYEIDVEDESTWQSPNQNLLDLGFNIWYRQKGTNIYLGHIYGSLVKTILEATILSKSAY